MSLLRANIIFPIYALSFQIFLSSRLDKQKIAKQK